MNDWNMWLGSNETRVAIKLLNEYADDLRDAITDGSHIQEKSTEKISLDYTYSLGQLEGVRTVIEMLRDIVSLIEDEGNKDDRS